MRGMLEGVCGGAVGCSKLKEQEMDKLMYTFFFSFFGEKERKEFGRDNKKGEVGKK